MLDGIEKAVIGASILLPKVFPALSMVLTPEHFDVPEYKKAWEIMESFYKDGQVIDLQTVGLKFSNSREAIVKIVESTDVVSSDAHTAKHAAFLVDRMAKRIVEQGQKAAAAATDAMEALGILEDTADKARKELAKVSNDDLYVWEETHIPSDDAFRMGFQYKNLDHIWIMSRSDLCVVTGSRGSMKTTFIYTLVAGAINNMPYLGFTHRRQEGQVVTYFDTEQSDDRLKRNMARISASMVSTKDFVLHGLSNMDTEAKLRHVINYILFAPHQHYMVIVDGLVDLTDDENNNIEARRLIHSLRRACNKRQCMCIVVMHPRRGEKFSTGHVGAYVEKKADAAFYIEFYKNEGKAKIECVKSREAYPPDVWVQWERGLLKLADPPEEKLGSFKLNQ